MPDPHNPLPGDNKCTWVWIGIAPWELEDSGCTEGTSCIPPQNAGSFIGEHEFTNCDVVDG